MQLLLWVYAVFVSLVAVVCAAGWKLSHDALMALLKERN